VVSQATVMKVLFVSSGRQGDVGFVVKNQGESLVKNGVSVDFFTTEPGICGYLKAVLRLRITFRRGSYNLVHAHYSFSAFTATLAGCRPLVVSLMGSDTTGNRFLNLIISILSRGRWRATVVKTKEMQRSINLRNVFVIPNGVDLNRFRPLDKEFCRKQLGLDENEMIILFIAGLNRAEKRLSLATEAVGLLNESNLRFFHLHDTPNEQVPFFINSADLLLLTSSREGSVYVVKEAMACNCPVVSTDVGDVKFVFGDMEGCFLTSSDPNDIADGIKKGLNFRKRTSGRKRLVELGLDADSIAGRLIDLYRQVMNQRQNENTGK